jgi:hypothetical protein
VTRRDAAPAPLTAGIKQQQQQQQRRRRRRQRQRQRLVSCDWFLSLPMMQRLQLEPCDGHRLHRAASLALKALKCCSMFDPHVHTAVTLRAWCAKGVL